MSNVSNYKESQGIAGMETHYEYTNFSILVPGPSQIVQTLEIRFKLSRMYSIPNGFIVSNIARFENLDGLLLEMGGNCFVTERSSLDPIAWQRKRNMISKVGVGFFPTVSTSIGVVFSLRVKSTFVFTCFVEV